jgi:flagellar biosynthesis protein FlhG
MTVAPNLTPRPARLTTAPIAPQDQAARLRLAQTQLDHDPSSFAPAEASAPAWARPAFVLAIASGKGGVGKTNITVNLAAQLARATRKRIAVLDLDAGLANVDLLCGIDPRRRLSLTLASREQAAASMAAVSVATPFGFTVIPGHVGSTEIQDARPHLLTMLDALAPSTDLLLIDLGAGLGPWVRSGLTLADWPIIVTTPEPPALADAYALIKVVWSSVARPATPPRVVVNTVRTFGEAEATFARLANVTERFLRITPALACALPDDPAVPHAVRSRALFALQQPSSQVAHSLRHLTAQVLQHVGEGLFSLQDPQPVVAPEAVTQPIATRPWSKLTRLIAARLRPS